MADCVRHQKKSENMPQLHKVPFCDINLHVVLWRCFFVSSSNCSRPNQWTSIIRRRRKKDREPFVTKEKMIMDPHYVWNFSPSPFFKQFSLKRAKHSNVKWRTRQNSQVTALSRLLHTQTFCHFLLSTILLSKLTTFNDCSNLSSILSQVSVLHGYRFLIDGRYSDQNWIGFTLCYLLRWPCTESDLVSRITRP